MIFYPIIPMILLPSRIATLPQDVTDSQSLIAIDVESLGVGANKEYFLPNNCD